MIKAGCPLTLLNRFMARVATIAIVLIIITASVIIRDLVAIIVFIIIIKVLI